MAYKKLKYWFDEELAKMLAQKIEIVHPSFPTNDFVNYISDNVEGLELKNRVAVIADAFDMIWPNNFEKATTILMLILGPENQEETGMFTNYYWIMPIAYYVEKYGLDYFSASMEAIEQITKRNTGEYAIRPFLERYPKKTLSRMLVWSKDKNSHVRRLASEGVRPRLPWARKMDLFITDPTPVIPILNNLKDDSSKYVQKSVANCVNDILKDNRSLAIELLEGWASGQISQSRQWIIKHAMRNALKKDEGWAHMIMKKML